MTWVISALCDNWILTKSSKCFAILIHVSLGVLLQVNFSLTGTICRFVSVMLVKGLNTWAVPREDQHCGLCVKFQESLLYTSISQRRNVSARISLRRLRKLIWVDILRRDHNVGFLVERLKLSNYLALLCEVNIENRIPSTETWTSW